MVSIRLTRSISAAVAATAVAATVGTSVTPASAAPPPPGKASDAANQLRDLSRQAEMFTEDFKKAQDDHSARQADLAGAHAETARAEQSADQARANEGQFRGQVDRLTHASYQGARMTSLSALLGSRSPSDFLDRSSALDVLAKDNNDALQSLSRARGQAESASHQAQDARARAARAEADAARIQAEIGGKKAAMDDQVAKVKQQYESLSQQEQQALSGGSSTVGAIGGTGAAVTAVNAALSKQGSTYVFGAKGPSQFDCSGLIQYAYKQAGIDLPASTKSQVSIGKQVPESQLKPGDVIFFYNSASHNGLYIGGGKMVHAPTEGQDVTVEEVKYMGQIHSVRRIAS